MDGIITLTGANFTTIANAGVDVKGQLDFTKMQWDIDGAGTGGVVFEASDFTTFNVTDATTLTGTLTTNGKAKLEDAAGFAADGIGDVNASDNIDVQAGFGVDAAGNPSVTDASANMSPTYSDTVRPFITSFSSQTQAGSYKAGTDIDIVATLSEKILGGSSITATMDTGGTVELTASTNGTTMSGVYTVRPGDTTDNLDVDSFAVTTGGLLQMFLAIC